MYNQDGMSIVIGEKKILRKKARPVQNFKDPKLENLIKRMVKTLQLNNGLGLSAPQVNEDLQIFVIELNYEIYIMINPTIKHFSKDSIVMEEGCISFPNIFKPIKRSKKVTVKYFDEKGEKKTIKAKGLLARAIQHEYDHLHGIIFLDRYRNQ